MKKESYILYKFLQVEIHKIDEDKYFQGIKQHSDPGNSFVSQWIQNNAASFREKWNLSKCKNCKFWKICGHLLKQNCDDFEFDEDEETESL